MLKSSIVAALVFAATGASAATATSNLSVTATVAANCTISTAPVAFGSAYDTVAGTAVNATGTVTIACTKNATSTISLGLGANASGSTRRMKDAGTTFLSYELYQQPTTVPGTACNYTGAQIWGTVGAAIYTPAAAPSTTARAYNVCGQITGGQDVPAATYSDTVLATVTF